METCLLYSSILYCLVGNILAMVVGGNNCCISFVFSRTGSFLIILFVSSMAWGIGGYSLTESQSVTNV